MSTQRLVIGVDVGMTCTGVAYAHDHNQGARILDEDWPGAEGETRKKVPTLLVYSKKNNGPDGGSSRPPRPRATSRSASRSVSHSLWQTQQLSSWGFNCLEADERHSDDKLTREFFKLFLDDGYLRKLKERKPDFNVSHDDVCLWYKDFLTKLYQHIKNYFMAKKPDLWKGKVRFVFSVPTTWDEARVVDRFKTIFREAGFGTEHNHSADVLMTEAQAAAVATATEKDHLFKKGQVVLVCDAGGGTTDLALLQVQSNQGEPLKLKSLHQVIGRTVGSTHIDRDFQAFARAKLEQLDSDEIEDVNAAVVQMSAHRNFERHKCNLSPETLEDDVPFLVKIPGLTTSHPELGIEGGKLRFKPSDMVKYFDARLEKIYEAVDEQISCLGTLKGLTERERKLDFIVLSGGLGSSKYVKHKLEQRYCGSNSETNTAQTSNMMLLQATQPQTVVCQGLVIDEMSTIHNKSKPLQNWVAHRSYGIVGIKKFDPNSHLEIDKVKDDLTLDQTGRTYADNQITWVVDKGERLDVSSQRTIPARRRFRMDSDASRRQWESHMVWSDLPLSSRPSSTSEPGSHSFCMLISDFSNVDPAQFELENKIRIMPGVGKKQSHRIASYEIKVVVGAADVKFELWYDGKKRSKEANSNVNMDIEWSKDTAYDEIDPPKGLFAKLNLFPLRRKGTGSVTSS